MKHTKFEQAYIECMLWSSTDSNDEPFDSNYSLSDFSEETLMQIKQDCEAFQAKCGELLDTIDNAQAGHDFWLTRNHHGAGFWDRGLGELGEKLTNIAESFGEQSPYVGDDGKVYL